MHRFDKLNIKFGRSSKQNLVLSHESKYAVLCTSVCMQIVANRTCLKGMYSDKLEASEQPSIVFACKLFLGRIILLYISENKNPNSNKI